MGSDASEENIRASTRLHRANFENTNTQPSLLNTPLAVPLTTLSMSSTDVALLFRSSKSNFQD
jgi:hypothetical protein